MPYLSAEDYIDRYGERETIVLTDEAKTGAVDSEKLAEAIQDATDEIDGYIAKRYATPLAEPPRLIVGMTAILARAYLHKTRPTPAVQSEADRVRKQLADISRGVMVIPGIDGGVVEPEGGLSDSSASGDGTDPVFNSDSMAGFNVPTGPGLACWKQ